MGDWVVNIPSISSDGAPDILSTAPPRLDLKLAELYDENVIAKIWRVAASLDQKQPPAKYPNTVPQAGHQVGQYEYCDKLFWTCGFFPGSLYTLLERCMKYPKNFPLPEHIRPIFHDKLLQLCRFWDGPLHTMSSRTDTHDMGFIIQPALRNDWELTGNPQSLQSIVTAADALASRYSEKVAAIRSWGDINEESHFLVIIDSMCNLDLLCYAGYHTGNLRLIDIATTHAYTVLKNVVREDFSTFHVVDFDSHTGKVKQKKTSQGYSDSSTWARGQAWGILGFAQLYGWTKDFGIFDAPPPPSEPPLRDTSAGMIAAKGLLLLHQFLSSQAPQSHEPSLFLDAAIKIASQTLDLSLSLDKVKFSRQSEDIAVVDNAKVPRFDAILRNATANFNESIKMNYRDHGLVYADYYMLEFGNKLLRLGLC